MDHWRSSISISSGAPVFLPTRMLGFSLLLPSQPNVCAGHADKGWRCSAAGHLFFRIGPEYERRIDPHQALAARQKSGSDGGIL
jgi:hypothetical protein